jgi:Tol biopolymer transport system component
LPAATDAAPTPTPTPAPTSQTARATSAPAATAATGPTTAAASINLFVFNSGDGSHSVHDPGTHDVRVLLMASAKNFYDAPSFSPDGTRIVFVYTNFDDAGKLTNEIRSVRVDGSDVQTLFKAPPTGPAIYFGYPRYSLDGASLTFSIIVEGATPRDNQWLAVRGPTAGGNWKVFLDNGYEPHFSSDDKKVVFLRANTTTFYTSLWIANANGTGAQQLVAEDIFLEVAGPHFSPDGQWIVFAASGPESRKLPALDQPSTPNRPPGPGLTPPYRPAQTGCPLQCCGLEARCPPRAEAEPELCAVRLLFACLVSRAYANGLPWELWLVSTDGKHFKQLTTLQLDSPWPAFSRDGRYIAFLTFDGMYEYDRDSGRVLKLSTEGGHGVIDWYQK